MHTCIMTLCKYCLNRYELGSQSTSNPGIEAIWEDERSRRRERDEDSQIPLDHSQPRLLPDYLSEKELHFFQVWMPISGEISVQIEGNDLQPSNQKRHPLVVYFKNSAFMNAARGVEIPLFSETQTGVFND